MSVYLSPNEARKMNGNNKRDKKINEGEDAILRLQGKTEMSNDAKNIIDSLNFCYGYRGIYLSEYKINRTMGTIPNHIPKHKKDAILNTLNKYKDDYVKGEEYTLLTDTIKKIFDAE